MKTQEPKVDSINCKKSRMQTEDIESLITNWVSKTLNDKNALWEVSISKEDSSLGFNVSVNYMKNTIGISSSVANKYRILAYPVIEKMIDEKILLTLNEGKAVAGIEKRRVLLNWFRKLSESEKHDLPIFGNQISLARINKEQCPITYNDLRLIAVRKAWTDIHAELKKLRIIDCNYKRVDQRIKEKNNEPQSIKETIDDRFIRLGGKKLNTATDFLMPTINEPFIQVEQLFANQILTVASKSGKSNYQIAYSHFVKFLSETYGNSLFIITEIFDEHLLSRYRKYLEQKIISKDMSSHHANTMLSAVRKVLERLTKVQGLPYKFFDINGFDTSRETDFKKPFTQKERLQLLTAIEKGIEESKKFLLPYIKTGIGENPLNERGLCIRGLSTLDNARWIFENLLNCKPVHYNTAKTSVEKSFLRIINNSEKGLQEVYTDWGIKPIFVVDVILPYFLKLAQVTGMNADSLLALNIDDYVENHPATSKPCLRYWKERSDGHKEYHLDLFNADLTWLTSGQAKSVKQIFQDVIELTENIRKYIDDEKLKTRLFIYQSDSSKSHGKVSSLTGLQEENPKVLSSGLARFVEKYQLKNDSGEPLTLTISRFRPTFVSEMLDNGVSLREIQVMLGHATIRTTIQYIDSLDFNKISRTKLNDKIKEIHYSTLEEEIEVLNEVMLKEANASTVTFHTPLAQCKNIFDPPDFVKNLSSYVHGTPCSQYNKCLSCDNVIITAKNLPEIFAMKRDYTNLINNTHIMDTPYGHIVKENMTLLEGILDPEFSDFSQDELEQGERLSEYIDITTIIDGVI